MRGGGAGVSSWPAADPTMASVRSARAARVNFSLSCSRLPSIAAPGTEATSPANTSGSINAGIHRTRKVPWSGFEGSLRRRFACTSCGTNRPCITVSIAAAVAAPIQATLAPTRSSSAARPRGASHPSTSAMGADTVLTRPLPGIFSVARSSQSSTTPPSSRMRSSTCSSLSLRCPSPDAQATMRPSARDRCS